jgi:hypothetical protein
MSVEEHMDILEAMPYLQLYFATSFFYFSFILGYASHTTEIRSHIIVSFHK